MKLFHSQKGFTFVETLLSVIIVGAIAGVAAKVLLAGLDVYSLVANRNEAFHTARAAMERIEDELVLINSTDVLTMTSSRFQFIDSTNDITDFRRTIISRNGRTVPCIMRENDYLAGNVSQLRFSYYRSDGSIALYPWDLRRINIDFTVQGLGSAGNVHMRSDVFPRNFMYSNFQ